jgi:hypothetical protein
VIFGQPILAACPTDIFPGQGDSCGHSDEVFLQHVFPTDFAVGMITGIILKFQRHALAGLFSVPR